MKARRRNRRHAPTEFGTVLENARMEIGLTVDELAARSAISASALKQAITKPTKPFRRARITSLLRAFLVAEDSEIGEALRETYDALPSATGDLRASASASWDGVLADAFAARYGAKTERDVEIAAWLRAGEWRAAVASAAADGHPYDWLADATFPERFPEYAESWRDVWRLFAKYPEDRHEALAALPWPAFLAESMEFGS
jgi:hypothetical protein